MEPDDLTRAVLAGLADGRCRQGRQRDRRRVAREDGVRREVRREAGKDCLLDGERFADSLQGFDGREGRTISHRLSGSATCPPCPLRLASMAKSTSPNSPLSSPFSFAPRILDLTWSASPLLSFPFLTSLPSSVSTKCRPFESCDSERSEMRTSTPAVCRRTQWVVSDSLSIERRAHSPWRRHRRCRFPSALLR